MEQKFKLMLARFPYGGDERTEIVDWVASAQMWASREPRVSSLLQWHINDTPITMCRNRAVRQAVNQDVDFLIMLDSDMAPDIDRSKPFLPAAFEFAVGRYHEAPTIVAAPYCTAPPDELPTMGRWRTNRDGAKIKADLYTREEALGFHGILPVPLLGTGLMLIDMRIFTGFKGWQLPPPWFDYEWRDQYQDEKVSTEDMFFSRNVSMVFASIGIETNFVAWDCWSYHVKKVAVGKPMDMTPLALHTLLLPNQAHIEVSAGKLPSVTVEPVMERNSPYDIPIAQAEPTASQEYITGLHERLKGFNGA